MPYAGSADVRRESPFRDFFDGLEHPKITGAFLYFITIARVNDRAEKLLRLGKVYFDKIIFFLIVIGE